MSWPRRVRSALLEWADSGEEEMRDLRREHGSRGATTVAQAPDRTPVTLRGSLRTVTLVPRGSVPTVEADLDDGTGVVTLVWLGRRRIAGIETGRSLTATGRVGVHEGRRVLFNPRYELMP